MNAEDLVLEIIGEIKEDNPGVKVPKGHYQAMIKICEMVMTKIPVHEKEIIKGIVLRIFHEMIRAVFKFRKLIDDDEMCGGCPKYDVCHKSDDSKECQDSSLIDFAKHKINLDDLQN